MSEQKKFEGYTDGQMAREIMMNALAEALDTNNSQVRTELEQIGDEYSEAKMMRVRKILAQINYVNYFETR